jgi:hypothetical protein
MPVFKEQTHFSEVPSAPLRLKNKTAETQRNSKRKMPVLKEQMHFSEVPSAPLRLKKNRRDAKK